MWNLVVMYGGGPLDVLSFAEDNIVGTLEVRPCQESLMSDPSGNLRFKCRERALNDSDYQWNIR